MYKKEEYDSKVNEIKTKLGDDFAKVSDIIADLSLDYDSVIQNDEDKNKQIDKLKQEKFQVLETNNKLFAQLTNKEPETKDPVIKNHEENGDNKPTTIDSVVNEKGDLE